MSRAAELAPRCLPCQTLRDTLPSRGPRSSWPFPEPVRRTWLATDDRSPSPSLSTARFPAMVVCCLAAPSLDIGRAVEALRPANVSRPCCNAPGFGRETYSIAVKIRSSLLGFFYERDVGLVLAQVWLKYGSLEGYMVVPGTPGRLAAVFIAMNEVWRLYAAIWLLRDGARRPG